MRMPIDKKQRTLINNNSGEFMFACPRNFNIIKIWKFVNRKKQSEKLNNVLKAEVKGKDYSQSKANTVTIITNDTLLYQLQRDTQK